MKTVEEIEYELRKLAVVAGPHSPVPDQVRYRAQDICHVLSWVLRDDVSINPYNVIAGCCCIRSKKFDNSTERLELQCSIGPDMCLNPSEDVAPDVPPLDHNRRLFHRPWEDKQ